MGHAEGAGGTGILLVRFTEGDEPPDAGDDAGSPDPIGEVREAGVVGDRLDAVPRARLADALSRAGPWKGSETNAPFFADEGGRRGR